MSRKKAEQETKEPTIYVGPTISSWPLKQYTTFVGGVLPEHLTEKIEQHPEIKQFIVSTSGIANIEAKIADKTSIQALQFGKIKNIK